jgi:hypothetical protein
MKMLPKETGQTKPRTRGEIAFAPINSPRGKHHNHERSLCHFTARAPVFQLRRLSRSNAAPQICRGKSTLDDAGWVGRKSDGDGALEFGIFGGPSARYKSHAAKKKRGGLGATALW